MAPEAQAQGALEAGRTCLHPLQSQRQPGALRKGLLLGEVLIVIPLQIFALVSSGWALLGCEGLDRDLQQFKNHSSNPRLPGRARWGLEGVCHIKSNPRHVLVVSLATTGVGNHRDGGNLGSWDVLWCWGAQGDTAGDTGHSSLQYQGPWG